ncbi:3'-5' exonuclease [Aurantimonas coralicida]|nr:3'-5' exonuclease [Aurantimonas coralicida]MCC4298322.1 3'-5' exonuclease [Aurantimonas coralicida]
MAAMNSPLAARQTDLFAELHEAPSSKPAPSEPVADASVVPTPREGPTDNDEALAQQLERTGRYRILRKLEPRPIRENYALNPGERVGIILDTETTGLDHRRDEIIELGMVAFTYDDGGIREVINVFSQLQEPSVPISAEITRITGITDDMVAGRSIDLSAVAAFIEPSDLVIAHNAKFDRPFCERFAPGFDIKPWACSVSEVDWSALGFEGSKLAYLVGQCGWFHNGHRAVDDCHALLEVLAAAPRADGIAAFQQLATSSSRTRLRLFAEGSPFDMKDVLKARGYRWSDGSNGRPKCWWVEIEEDDHALEMQFMREEIYRADVDLFAQRLTACERFKA